MEGAEEARHKRCTSASCAFEWVGFKSLSFVPVRTTNGRSWCFSMICEELVKKGHVLVSSV